MDSPPKTDYQFTHHTTDVYESFTKHFDQNTLNQMVDAWITHYSAFDTEYWSAGGAYRAAIGWILDQNKARINIKIVDQIMDHYNVRDNSVPPKMALRQALAARLNQRLADKELRKHWQIDEDLLQSITIKLEKPSDVYQLDDNLLDTVLQVGK